MKKIEIINLIRANRIIDKNSKLLSITRDKRFPNIKIDIEYWFPDIEELKGEFEILKKEVLDVQEESIKCQEIINKSKCNHEVRLKHFGLFGSHSNCIFCNKTIMGDNCVNWEYSVNRNNYCVDFIAKYQDDEDYDNICEGYTEEDIYLIIAKLLEDRDENEEIDLVQELKRLNLEKSIISEKKIEKEDYILIISGTNKQYLDNETYIQNKINLNIALEILNYFFNLLNTKIELIDCKKHQIENLSDKVKLVQYETIDNLEQILIRQQEIPFKIIIDITELYEYTFKNEKIIKKETKINLEELYPNSIIIRIKNLSNKRKEELLAYLKEYQSLIYAYQYNKYYSYNEGTLDEQNQEEIFSRIKMMLAQ